MKAKNADAHTDVELPAKLVCRATQKPQSTTKKKTGLRFLF